MANDALTIFDVDELVLGNGTDDDWGRLLLTPNASALWRRAVARRAWIDILAEICHTRPEALVFVTPARAVAGNSQAFGTWVYEEAAETDLVSATLGPASAGNETERELRWGGVARVPLALGQRYRVENVPDTRVWFVEGDNASQLPSSTWQLEVNESPVLLFVLRGSADAEGFDEALATATDVALIVLVEASPSA